MYKKDNETSHQSMIHEGRVIEFRPVTPNDNERLAAFARGLSFSTRYFRFGRGDAEFTDDQVERLCNPDAAVARHLIAVTDENGKCIQIGSARFQVEQDGESCDLGILVADAWQGTRVAHRLIMLLIDSARERGLKRMTAHVLGTNVRMLRFARRHGFVAVPGCERPAIETLSLCLQGI